MASVSLYSSTPNPNPHLCFSSPRTNSHRFAFESSLFGSKLPEKLLSISSEKRGRNLPKVVSASSQSFDVVIIGAGIVGLTIARQFLTESDLSVAVVDKAVPCSGATGAGQGYIWMGHKTPGSDSWELALRSYKLWEMLAVSIADQGLNPLEVLGWKKTGSLLVGKTADEILMLKKRVKLLCEAGLKAEYLSSSDLRQEEPALIVGDESGAAFVPDDCQLDAQRTVAFLEKGNRNFASNGRYAEFYNNPVTSLLRSASNGEVKAVQTSKNTLYIKKAVVVAAGSWSGSLMHDLVRELDIALKVPVTPRKGHLLVLENFYSLQLNHGLMEVGYVDHQTVTSHPTISSSAPVEHGQSLSISMTATIDAIGNLVLGSSRQFAGFSIDVEESIVDRIWERAGIFFPKLRELPLTDFYKSRKVRVGLRPYMLDGKPLIGPVPNLSNVFLATGHEGCGLAMSLGTAEMVTDMVLGNSGKVDYTPFAVQGRC